MFLFSAISTSGKCIYFKELKDIPDKGKKKPMHPPISEKSLHVQLSLIYN